MSHLTFMCPLDQVRLNLGVHGSGHIAGDGSCILTPGELSQYSDDSKWFASLKPMWEVVPNTDPHLPVELNALVTAAPQLSHAYLWHSGSVCGIFVAAPPQQFAQLWDLAGRHLGSQEVLIELAMILEGFYGFGASDISLRPTFGSGKTVSGTVTIGLQGAGRRNRDVSELDAR